MNRGVVNDYDLMTGPAQRGVAGATHAHVQSPGAGEGSAHACGRAVFFGKKTKDLGRNP